MKFINISAFIFSAVMANAGPFTVDTSTLYVSGGQVGIKTTSPGTTLDVNGGVTIRDQETVTSTLTVKGNGFSVGGSTFIVTGGKVGISGAGTPLVHTLEVNGNTHVGSQSAGQALIQTPISSAGSPTYSFFARDDSGMFLPSSEVLGFATNGSERVRISSAGYVGVGTTSPQQVMHVVGTIRQSSIAGCATSLTSNGSGDIICSVSDRKLKTSIRPLPQSGKIIDALAPSLYLWKDPDARDKMQHAGFIAEDVAAIFPEGAVQAGYETLPSTYTYTVKTNNHTYIRKGPELRGEQIMGVDPNALIALLIKEVQDLRKRISVLEAAQKK